MNEVTQVSQVSPRLSDQAYLHTVTAGAVVPLVQSVVTGTLAGLFSLVILVYFRLPYWLVVSLLVWLSVTGLTWVILQRHWFALTLATVERLTGFDIDQDGYVGQAVEPAVKKVRLDITQVDNGGYTSETRDTLPIDDTALSILAAGLLGGRPFSEKEWSGSGKLLSVDEFREVREVFERRGIVAQVSTKDVRQGYKVTAAGRHVLRHFSPTGVDAVVTG